MRGDVELGRHTPVFDDGEPLAEARVSRSPLSLSRKGNTVEAWPGREGLRYTIDGRPGTGGEVLAQAALDGGVLIELGSGATLLVESAWTPAATADHGFVGVSRGLDAVRAGIEAASVLPRSALIQGPSGSGKELVARALHASGPRPGGPFVAVNMAAVPATVAASQLFGHARGAFTGAASASEGLFRQAHRGTLFLDEVGACPLAVQVQLLRALESGEIQPVGGPARRVDVRVVAATDEDLDAAIAEGRFHKALYYRLARTPLSLPALAQRPADVAVQAFHFARAALAEARLPSLDERGGSWLTRAVMRGLLDHPWEGNTRELIAVVEGLVVKYGAEPEALWEVEQPLADAPAVADLSELLERNGYRLQVVAKELGVGINTLRKRMAEQGFARPKDLDQETIRAAVEQHGVAGGARALRVSVQGLRLRARALGLELDG